MQVREQRRRRPATTESTSARSSSSTGVSQATQTNGAPAHAAGSLRESQRPAREARRARGRPGPARRAAARRATGLRSPMSADRSRGGNAARRQARRGHRTRDATARRRRRAGRKRSGIGSCATLAAPTDWPAGTRACCRMPSRIVRRGAQPRPLTRRRVEQDERAVANPAALAAGVLRAPAARRAPRKCSRATCRPHVLRRAEIEDVDRRVRLARSRSASRRRSPGRTGSSCAAARCRAPRCARIGAQLLEEVEHVAVRVALAEDRDEPEDVRLEAEAGRVGARAAPRRRACWRRRAMSGWERAPSRASGRRRARRRSSPSKRTRCGARRSRASPRAR